MQASQTPLMRKMFQLGRRGIFLITILVAKNFCWPKKTTRSEDSNCNPSKLTHSRVYLGFSFGYLFVEGLVEMRHFIRIARNDFKGIIFWTKIRRIEI